MVDGCLIVHGLTGTPATMASFQRAFIGAGYTVNTPCLAGHGGSVEDLSKVSWEDWYDTVRISYMTLKRDVDRVFCAGTSLGALLCLKLALDEGWGIKGIALLGTPLRLSMLERIAISMVRHTPLKAIIKNIPKDWNKSIADPAGRLKYEQMSLPKIPLNAVFEIIDLQVKILASLSKISHPLLIMHGKEDKVAPLMNVDILKNTVASSIIESMIFEDCRHILTMDYKKERVAKTALYFFKRFSK
ncbi:MAG: alpha/beta fold hydrolase [Deltaproteobacteria bacterium]|jgi:carboxylesterase|nr:alpha/beta fold hydrolase [Deltaproteobacteria bacterium]